MYWTTGRSGFDPRQRQKDLSSVSVCRSPLGPIQPPTQWVPGSFPDGKARPRRDADHSPPSSAEVMNEQELYLLSPLRLHRVLWDCFKVKSKAVLLHAMEALGGRGGIAPTHSRPRH
jgi:hypothetical protein